MKAEAMIRKMTIMLLDNMDILSAVIKLSLTSQKDWNLISISPEQNTDSLLQLAETYNPDMIIFEQVGCSSDSSIPAALLHVPCQWKVISINLVNSMIEVYSKQNISVRSETDLLSVIAENLKFQQNGSGL